MLPPSYIEAGGAQLDDSPGFPVVTKPAAAD
jgi:hypothetical protein